MHTFIINNDIHYLNILNSLSRLLTISFMIVKSQMRMEKNRKQKDLFYSMKMVKRTAQYPLVLMILSVRLLQSLENLANGTVSYQSKQQRKSQENTSLFHWKFVKNLGNN